LTADSIGSSKPTRPTVVINNALNLGAVINGILAEMGLDGPRLRTRHRHHLRSLPLPEFPKKNFPLDMIQLASAKFAIRRVNLSAQIFIQNGDFLYKMAYFAKP
jgi:hypothetical protein